MSYSPALRRHIVYGVFPYDAIPAACPEVSVLSYRDRVRARFTTFAKAWQPRDNSEWMLRNYLAAKFLMASSLLLSSEAYAERKGLHVTRPYLVYYGLFQACRAFMLSVPFQEWRSGDLLRASHDKIANVVTDELRHIDGPLAQRIGQRLLDARSLRELFSYSFPGGGLSSITYPASLDFTEAVHIATLLGELAQLNSEALDAALDKHVSETPGFDVQYLLDAALYKTVDGQTIVDQEDLYRVKQLMRNVPRPTNIWSQTREGMIEDFTDNWSGGEDSENDAFDADEAWRLIFPFM
jgi:hypothetical protein